MGHIEIFSANSRNERWRTNGPTSALMGRDRNKATKHFALMHDQVRFLLSNSLIFISRSAVLKSRFLKLRAVPTPLRPPLSKIMRLTSQPHSLLKLNEVLIL